MEPTSKTAAGMRTALLCALLVAAVIVVPRSFHVGTTQSPAYDADKHFYRGVQFLERDLGTLVIDNPPLGPGILAAPLWVAGIEPAPANGRAYTPLMEYSWSIETINTWTAAWGGVLFLTLVGVAFAWCWKLYGPAAAWLATVVLVFEPNFAAHAALIGTDSLGTIGVVGGCAVCWWWSKAPSGKRTTIAAAALAAAMLLKHTAILLPVVAVTFALLNRKSSGVAWPPLVGRVVAAAGMTLLFIWASTLFDVSRPLYAEVDGIPPKFANHWAVGPLTKPWPAGSFIRSLLSAIKTSQTNSFQAYLFGETYSGGRLSYFPFVASVKVPLAVMGLVLLGSASLVKRRPTWAEWSLFVPLVLWTLLTMTNKVNIGFRHALPLYALVLLLSCRCMSAGRSWRWVGGVLAGVLVLMSVLWHPHYLVYDNGIYPKPHEVISDSNVDWAHALPAVAEYVQTQSDPGPYHFAYFGPTPDQRVAYYLGDAVNYIERDGTVPTRGVLLLSPVREVGLFDEQDRFARFRDIEPDGLIAGTIRVYDLDAR